MNLRTVILIFYFCCFGTLSLIASDQLGNSSNPLISVSHQLESNEKEQAVYRNWLRLDKVPNRISLATRSGFVVLREEEILSVLVHPNESGLLLSYRKNGKSYQVACRSNLSKVMERLGSFPFVKVSRKCIVNLNEVDRYEGTKRDASLVLTDGSKIKVSRNMAAPIYNWLEHLST